MITIQSLEVHFDVEGDDTQRFARLFRDFIRQWSAETERQRMQEHQAARERSLVDAPMGGMEP